MAVAPGTLPFTVMSFSLTEPSNYGSNKIIAGNASSIFCPIGRLVNEKEKEVNPG
jgi:hypothetical protein